MGVADDDDGDFPSGQILLIAHVLVGGNEYFEPLGLRNVEQVAVRQPVPSQISRLGDDVDFRWSRRGAGVLWSKRTRIGQLSWFLRQGGRRVETAGREFKHTYDLLPSEVEPLHDFLDAGARFEVLKDDGNRHAGVAKDPGAADLAGDAFDGGAL